MGISWAFLVLFDVGIKYTACWKSLQSFDRLHIYRGHGHFHKDEVLKVSSQKNELFNFYLLQKILI